MPSRPYHAYALGQPPMLIALVFAEIFAGRSWPKGAVTASSSRSLRTHEFNSLCICKCTPDGNVAQVLLVAADQSGDGRGLILPAEWEGLSVTFLRGARVMLRLAFGSGNRSVQPVEMMHN